MMHIPRQYNPAGRALTPEAQRHSAQLEHELRRTAYWRRLVQARLDLVVAGLLYAAPAPTSAATAGMVRTDPLRLAGRAADDAAAEGAPLAFDAPLGLDVSYLLDGGRPESAADLEAHRRGSSPALADTGARLDRLRELLERLSAHERSLVAELHAVASVQHEEVGAGQPVGGS